MQNIKKFTVGSYKMEEEGSKLIFHFMNTDQSVQII